jgi:hypothetical protein
MFKVSWSSDKIAPDPQHPFQGSQMEGSRLILEPKDDVRHPRVTSAIILPEHKPVVPKNGDDNDDQPQPAPPGQEAATAPDLDVVGAGQVVHLPNRFSCAWL